MHGALAVGATAGCDRAPEGGTKTSAPLVSARPASCEERLEKARSIVFEHRDRDAACTADTDCAEIHNDPDCWRSCGSVLARARVADRNARVKRANDGPCKNFAAECPVAGPTCSPESKPICKDGKCESGPRERVVP
jgi:hypothetical protein